MMSSSETNIYGELSRFLGALLVNLVTLEQTSEI